MSKATVFVLFLIITFVWRFSASKEVKDKIYPFAFAGVFINVVCAPFMPAVIHGIFGVLNYVLFAILCDGFALNDKVDNPSWRAFTVFLGYVVFSSLWGVQKAQGVFLWLNALVCSYGCGYFAALWILRTEGGMRRILTAMVYVAGITVIAYIRHGGLTQLDMFDARGGIDMDTVAEGMKFNVNAVAAHMVLLLVFLVLAIFGIVANRMSRHIKIAAIVLAVIAAITMVRSGSRSGGICLLPIIIYVLGTLKEKRAKVSTALVSMVLLAGVVVGLRSVMGGTGSLRAFSIIDKESNASFETEMEAITTGRVTLWQSLAEGMTTREKVFGRGLFLIDEKTGKGSVNNAHSIFVTIYLNSGIVGLALLLVAVSKCIVEGFRFGARGRMSLLLTGVWLLHGLGESWGMTGGAIAILAGMGIGLLSHCQIGNSEFLQPMLWNARIGVNKNMLWQKRK